MWKCILRFMGDLPEPKHNRQEKDYSSVMSKISATLGKNFSKTDQFKELSKALENSETVDPVDKKNISLTLKRQDKIGKLVSEDDTDTYSNWIDARPTTNLEKLHFITGFIWELLSKYPVFQFLIFKDMEF